MRHLALFTLALAATPAMAQTTFQITSLTNSNVTVVDAGVRGDSKGGLAVSSSTVFTTGDGGTGRFDKPGLTSGTVLGTTLSVLTSDLQTQQVYAFGTSATTPASDSTSATWSHLIAVNPDGSLGAAVALGSGGIAHPGGNTKILAGYGGYGLVYTTNDGGSVFQVDYITGSVTTLRTGFGPNFGPGNEGGVVNGVAEFFGGDFHMVVPDGDSSTQIARFRVSDGVRSIVADFPGEITDDMDFSVDVFTGRWYWHAEGNGSTPGFTTRNGLDENVGFADATFSIAAVPEPATIMMAGVGVAGAGLVTYRVRNARRKRKTRKTA